MEKEPARVGVPVIEPEDAVKEARQEDRWLRSW